MRLMCIAIYVLSCTTSFADIEDKVLTSPEAKQQFDSVVNQAKQTFSGGVNMLKGVGQGFGIVTPDYRYSFRVFNDAPAPIFVAMERLTGFMGATFSGEIEKDGGLTLGPNADSGEKFYNRQLYVSVWLCADKNEKNIKKYAKSSQQWAEYGAIAGAVAGMGAASPLTTALGAALGALAGSIATVVTLEKYKIYEKDIYPWPAKDDKIYFYRAYTVGGDLKGEYLDLAGTTSEFSGQFYNHSSKNIPLQFSKDGRSYTVTLEQNSFNLLESSKEVDYSIRPPQGDHSRGFQFYNGTVSEQNKIAFIPVSADGIGNVASTQKDASKPVSRDDLVVVGPKLYTYEIYDTQDGPEVGIQGLKIGHYAQPVSGAIRDINPAVCHVWYKDAKAAMDEMVQEQQKSGAPVDYSAIPFDIPEQVWVAYKTIDSTIQEKISTGTQRDFYPIRPQLQEKDGAWLYIVALQTNDDTKAKKFLDRLVSGKIGTQAIFTDVTTQQLDTKSVLSIKPNLNGFIADTQGTDASGITGAVLLADWFGSQGVGSGPFYYELDPSLLRVDQFANALWFDQKFYVTDPATGSFSLKPEVIQELATLLPQWINQYRTDQKAAGDALKKYLQEKGNAGDGTKENSGIFVDATVAPAQRQFTSQGQALLQTLLDGPISLKNYPIMRKAGINWYTQTLGDKPDSWPK